MNLSQIALLNYPTLPRRRIKFLLRVLWNGRKPIANTARTFNHPKLKRILDENPSQYTKIYHPYLYHGLNINDRVLSIHHHYEFIKKQWGTKLINSVYSENGLHLAKMVFDERVFSVVLQKCSGTRYESESEIIINLFSEQEKIMGICFNFTIDEQNDAGIFISSMQGSSDHHSSEHNQIIKEFTKKAGGMRPHAFLIYALTVIASAYQLKRIHALKTNSHLKRKRIKTNYDGFWADFGGESISETVYSIPLTYERKPIESIKSNKRSMYKNRYHLLDEVEKQIRYTLDQ